MHSYSSKLKATCSPSATLTMLQLTPHTSIPMFPLTNHFFLRHTREQRTSCFSDYIQLARLETMRQDDSLATCKRCHLNTPDTIHYWLLHCPALSRSRSQLDSKLEVWSKALDSTLNTRHSNSITARWMTLTTHQRIQALLCSTPRPSWPYSKTHNPHK